MRRMRALKEKSGDMKSDLGMSVCMYDFTVQSVCQAKGLRSTNRIPSRTLVVCFGTIFNQMPHGYDLGVLWADHHDTVLTLHGT